MTEKRDEKKQLQLFITLIKLLKAVKNLHTLESFLIFNITTAHAWIH